MSLIFERIETDGIAELSYLLGDDGQGIAAVFDPTPDVDKYVELARERNVSITHIFETHIHADLMSGSRELCARVDSAQIYGSGEAGAEYGFAIKKIREGNTFDFGKTRVTVRHTPGHTPEHVSYEIAEKESPKKPWGVLTGDSLFVSSAGRPDLLGSAQSKKLAAQQFHTLRDYFLKLPDSVIIHPAHGHGSPCGADIGDRLESTIGYERDSNPFLQFTEVREFTDYALSTAPPVPTYYSRMKKVNAKGPEILGNLPRAAALSAKAFREAVNKKAAVLIDTRDMLAFGGGHIAGALNIGAAPMLSIWAGWFLDPNRPVLLVLEADSDIDKVVKLFIRTGYVKFAGYLSGGMKSWNAAALPIEELPQMSVHELKGAAKSVQIFDVRSPDEWNGGHIPSAHHLFLPEIRKKAAKFDKTKPTAVYCASGYRASLGASMLQQEGFTNVHNVPGSWGAWKAAKFPVEKPEEAA